MNTENAASTPVDELQRQRERRELQRAQERSRYFHQQLVAKNAETSTAHGAALFKRYAEDLNLAIDALLTEFLSNSSKAGPHFAAWPLLLHFCDRGPRTIAAIALTVVINRISTSPRRADVAKLIGKALQDELKATRIHQQKGQLLLRLIKKKYGRSKTVSVNTMSALHVDPSGWTTKERRELGELLLEVIVANTELIEFQKRGRYEHVTPTMASLELVKANPPRPLPVRMLPSLLRPQPWEGVVRGTKALVSSRKPMDLSHCTVKSLATAITVVNTIEQQELVVDPWMVRIQREAWDCNLDVFPVRREPEKLWLMSMEAPARAKVEETIRQGEEVAGYPIWLEHDLDFRGRLYCASRIAGHQGPDHQKALISFAQRDVVDDDAFQQLLAAAAGHYGLGHSTWGERVGWGRDHLPLLKAVAENPLDRIDLWKGADDPWQFVQVARAVAESLDDDGRSGCPVRFDQTASGMGIIGALTRDERLCRLTNIIGDTREDLYTKVAKDLVALLSSDLQSWDFRDARMAEFWLKWDIGRDLAKGPTMTTIYGARHFGITEQLVTWLQEKNPDVSVAYWQKEYTRPAQYLAHKLNLVIAAELKSCVDLESWLRSVSAACMKRQKRIEWTSPMGFPLAFGSEVREDQKTNTVIHGARRWKRVDAPVVRGELSARETNRSITANTIHAFDAALVHAVTLRCAQVNAPLLTNHDCFATNPANAKWLHRTLLDELRGLYRPDWLPEMATEISQKAGVRLTKPPFIGTLCEGQIGENPYCFC